MEKMSYEKLLCGERIRKHSKPADASDKRSEFERDYHRIIGSASFRRLQDKTQVFALDSSDFVRTRLTHSLEVSSIAKSLGQSTGNLLVERGLISPSQAGDISDILLCAGLLHDIGNPPFGHFGETVIRGWYAKNLDTCLYKGKPIGTYLSERQKLDLLNFEGNAQSLRVVAKLHHLVDDNGMNLTKGVMSAIIKYPTPSDGINKKAGDIRLKKMGYFEADEDLFKDISQSTGTFDRRNPLVYLLEAADDIAYSTADIEDGFKKGILSYEELLRLVEDNRYTAEHKDSHLYTECTFAADYLKKMYARGLENNEPEPGGYAVQNWAVCVQSRLIRAVCASFIDHQEELLAGTYPTDLFENTEAHFLIRVLKEIAAEHIFCIKPIVEKEVAASSIIGGLMDMFVPALLKYDSGEKPGAVGEKLISLVSPNYLRHYHARGDGRSENERLYLRMILINDFIAGMTDSFARSLYRGLKGMD